MAKRVKFSDRYIDKTLQPKSTRYEILEGDGFTVRVTPAGVKTFYYVFKIQGKNRRLHLGEYPHTSLAEAREQHRQALTLRKNGQDPVTARQEELRAKEDEQRRLQNEKTVSQLAEYYLEEHARPNKKSWEKDEGILLRDVIPSWGDRLAREIRKRDVIELMESIIKRGSAKQSGEVLKIVRRMFNFAVERDILETTPCYKVKPLVKRESKERWLTTEELRALWAFLDDPKSCKMSDAMRCSLRLILLTAQRPGECRELPWREINGDWWTLPTSRSKNGREHRTFLTPLAKEQLRANSSAFVYPSPDKKRGQKAPMQKDAAPRAIRRLTSPQGPSKIIRLPIAPFTPHDLRRTAATHIGAVGYDNEQIGRLLNHADGTVTAIYNRHKYDGLIQEMLQAWETRLKEILAG